jgi:hypothetical protein
MFFRREHPKEPTFAERIEALRQAGFTVQPSGDGRVRVSRDGCGAVVEDSPGGPPRIAERAGVVLGEEIASLVDGGFQKFFRTPGGKKKPALAPELKAVHHFQEDLREALGLVSLYNESLGTVSNQYLYDRLRDRDRGVPKRPWE